jgi:hypothetical protein
MTLALPITAVGSPHDVIAPYMGPTTLDPLPEAADPLSQNLKLLIAYSGQLIFDFPARMSSSFATEDVFSFIPLSGGEVHRYRAHRREVVAAAVTASLASFETRGGFFEDSLTSVEEMGARIVPLTPGDTTGPHVLVLKVKVATERSIIHRVSYSVTVNITVHDDNQTRQTAALGTYTNPSTRITPSPSQLPPTW